MLSKTAVARNRVEDAETAIKQAQDDMRNAEKPGLSTTKHETTVEEMLNAFGDSLSDPASPEHGEDGEDEDDAEEDPAGGKLSEDDEPGWVMGTISNITQHRMESFRQKQMKPDRLTQPGWGDMAEYIRERDKKYETTELNVLAVIQPQMPDDAPSSVQTTFGEPMETLDCVHGKLQMPQVTSRPGSSHITIVLRKPQTQERIVSLPPAPMRNWSPLQQSNHDDPVCFNPCILHPKFIAI